MMRSESEPWFVPMRMATPRSLQLEHQRREALLDALQFGGVLGVGVLAHGELARVGVVAGLMRTFSTCSAAASAGSGEKWMSATSGTPMPRARRRVAHLADGPGVARRWAR